MDLTLGAFRVIVKKHALDQWEARYPGRDFENAWLRAGQVDKQRLSKKFKVHVVGKATLAYRDPKTGAVFVIEGWYGGTPYIKTVLWSRTVHKTQDEQDDDLWTPTYLASLFYLPPGDNLVVVSMLVPALSPGSALVTVRKAIEAGLRADWLPVGSETMIVDEEELDRESA